MTAPEVTLLRAMLEETAKGDRSIALTLLAILRSANAKGSALLSDVVVRYREEHLDSLRAEGKNAEHEAGRLSLDEVRGHLIGSTLPRLAADDIVALPRGGMDAPEARVKFSAPAWERFGPLRKVESDSVLLAVSEPVGKAAPAPPRADQRGSVLEAKGLVKMYRRRRVVNDVAVRLQQGEIVGLLGPNGAGKTTTFYMIVGLIQPLEGRIFLDGRDITSTAMYRRARSGIGYLSQEPSVFRKLSVEDNLRAILETVPHLSGAERRARLESLLDELSIKHLRHTKAYALSGGERRRLEITRALVTRPRFMMLDEPFAGVDPIAVHDIQTIVAGLRHRGIGVLISDHNVEQTLDIVDRAYIMFDGQVKVAGTVRELVYDDTVAKIYLGPTLTERLRARFSDMDGAA